MTQHLFLGCKKNQIFFGTENLRIFLLQNRKILIAPKLKVLAVLEILLNFDMLRNKNSNRYDYILKDVVFISDITKFFKLIILSININNRGKIRNKKWHMNIFIQEQNTAWSLVLKTFIPMLQE